MNTSPGVPPRRVPWTATVLLAAATVCMPVSAHAHGVAAGDKGYIQEVAGVLLVPFAYLGAKHMVTGYDHLLFLFGVTSSCIASATWACTSPCSRSGTPSP